MKVYREVPNTNLEYNTIESNQTSITECKKRCDDIDNCLAFVYLRDQSLCLLKDTQKGITKYDTNAILYTKEGNSSYWWLWLGIIGAIILIGIYLCKRKLRKV